MDITIHASFLPHDHASPAFNRDTLGSEVRNEVGYGGMRWMARRRGRPEPTDQPYGVRDCAFCDPAGNMIRIQEVR